MGTLYQRDKRHLDTDFSLLFSMCLQTHLFLREARNSGLVLDDEGEDGELACAPLPTPLPALLISGYLALVPSFPGAAPS